MWKLLRKRKKEKNSEAQKGSAAIMEVVTILIIVLAFAMLTDLILISTQHLHLAKIGNEVARTIAIQSGVRTSTPANYPGGSASYYTSQELLDFLNQRMQESGFASFYLEVNGTRISSSTSRTFDYRDRIRVELGGEYEWVLLRAFLPNLADRQHYIVTQKTVYAEYHF